MSPVFFCYPRITLAQAVQHWAVIRELPLVQVQKICDNTTVIGAEFYPFADVRSEDSELQFLRQRIIEIAKRYGYPNQVSSRMKVSFEGELTNIFQTEIAMSPAEASTMDVWHFFNLRLLADITLWRFGSFDEEKNRWSINEERLYIFNRNMFGRIWWRGHILGHELAGKLSEDETVQILERPTLYAYPSFAKAVGTRYLDSPSKIRATRVLRDASKRFTRRMAVLSVFIMQESQLTQFVDEVFTESEVAMLTTLQES